MNRNTKRSAKSLIEDAKDVPAKHSEVVSMAIDNALLHPAKRRASEHESTSKPMDPQSQQNQETQDSPVSDIHGSSSPSNSNAVATAAAAFNEVSTSSGAQARQDSHPSPPDYPDVLQARDAQVRQQQLAQRQAQEKQRDIQHEMQLANRMHEMPPPKPVVGSEEWNRIRKDNHKEVERRRRETINKGILDLSKVVPGCEKHKGQILSQAIDYIKKLKENEQSYLEKFALEKLVTEQMLQELSAKSKHLKSELERAWKESERWKTMYHKKLEEISEKS